MNAPTLRSNRLIMLPLSLADLDEMAMLYRDADVMKYIDGGPRDVDQTKSALSATERCWRAEGWGLWTIRDAVTGGLIGEAGLQYLTDVEHAEVDFGYTIAKRHWGNGYATEACHVILLDAWDRYGGDLIHAVARPENKTSSSVLRKLGFHLAEDRVIHGLAQQLWSIPRLR